MYIYYIISLECVFQVAFLGLCFQRLLGAHSQSWKMINIYRKTKTKLPAEKMRTTNPNKKRFPD